MKAPVCPTPRVRNAAATRQAMLAAARRRFRDESYDNVGLRDIAADVGVDVSLVSRYFGSKEGLFKEVLRSGKKKLETHVGAEALPDYLAGLVAGEDGSEDADHVERLLIILRSASSPRATAIVRAAMREDVLEPFARLLGGEDAEMRVSLCLALLMGTTIQRTIMDVGPLCECEPEVFRRKLVRMFEAALGGETGR